MSHTPKFSRRRFLAASGGAAVAGSALLASPRRVAAQGKTLRIASGESDSSKGTLDPAYSQNDPDSARISLVYERLVILDEDFVPKPQLAESWETNETGDVWTFKLLSGVKFQDGAPFTAQDVVFTYRRLIDPAIGSPGAPTLSSIDPDGIEAVDDHTVRFALKSPVVEFPSLIASRFTYILRQGQTSEEVRTRGIGTGPFKVQQFVPGEEPSIFVRNENYRQPGLPKIDTVELRAIPNPAAQIAALASGQIDLSWDLPRVGLETLKGNPDIKVVSMRSPYVMSIACWADTPPFDDVRVRQALKLCVDRQSMIQLALGGLGQLGNDSPVAPWMPYGIDEAPRGRDIEKAKALLAEAGHGDGLTVELYTSEAAFGMVEMATLFQAMASEAGINVQIVKAPAEDYWSNVWRKKPFMCGTKSGRLADEALSVFYRSDAEWNDTHWKHPEFDQLLADARQTIDAAKRTELYHKAQRLLQEDGGVIIPMFADAVGAARANIAGWNLHPQKFVKDFSAVEFTS